MRLYKYLTPEFDNATGELIFRSPVVGTCWEGGQMSRYVFSGDGIYAVTSPDHPALYGYPGVLVTLEAWGDCLKGENDVYIVEYARIVDYDPGDAWTFVLEEGFNPSHIPAEAEILIEMRRPELINRWRGRRVIEIAMQSGGSNYLRTVACGDPEMAFLYAYIVDGGPHEETRKAACNKPETAFLYADLIDQRHHDSTWGAMQEDGVDYRLKTAYQHAVNPEADHELYDLEFKNVLFIPRDLGLKVNMRLSRHNGGRMALTPDGKRTWSPNNSYFWPSDTVGLNLRLGVPLAYDIQDEDGVICQARVWGNLMLDTLNRGVSPRYIADIIDIIGII